jgi:hypothetical protein
MKERCSKEGEMQYRGPDNRIGIRTAAASGQKWGSVLEYPKMG